MKRFLYLLSCLTASIYFMACSKKDISASSLQTHISFRNFILGRNFDVYSNDSLLYSGLHFDSTLAFSKTYATGLGNLYNLKITKSGNTDSVYVEGTQYLQAGNYYDLTIIPPDTTNGIASTNISYSILTQSYPVFYTDSAKIRFFNFSQAAPLTTLAFRQPGLSNSSTLDTISFTAFKNRYYNDQSITTSYTGYQYITAGHNDYLQFFYSTKSRVEANMFYSLQYRFVRQHYYTIYLLGSDSTSSTLTGYNVVVVQDN